MNSPRASLIGRNPTVTNRRAKRGFTLVEMMAAIAVLMILLVIIAMATTGARTTITRGQATLGAFATARTAFENMTDKLSQATLNTYLDYYGFTAAASVSGPMVSRGVFMAQHGVQNIFTPQLFGRCSDLQFRIMQNQQHSYYGQEIYFQTPAAFSATSAYQSTQGLINSCSYFVQYCSDAGTSGYRPGAGPTNPTNILPSPATPANWRYRLMQGLEPSENMSTYSITAAAVAANGATAASLAMATTYLPWQANIQNKGATSALSTNVVPVADNVIMLSFWPRLPLKNDTAGTGLELLGCYDGTQKLFLYDSQADILNMFSSYTVGMAPPLQKPWDEQLPPIVEVTMVVIDEASAARLAATVTTPGLEPALIGGTGTPKGALISNGPSSYTTSNGANTLATDLQATENALTAAHLNFRIMSSYVLMREAKWSSSNGGSTSNNL
jgi:uncharacterized protein (TIGR02599 family)